MQTKPGVFVQKRRLANLFFFLLFAKVATTSYLKPKLNFRAIKKEKRKKIINFCICCANDFFLDAKPLEEKIARTQVPIILAAG